MDILNRAEQVSELKAHFNHQVTVLNAFLECELDKHTAMDHSRVAIALKETEKRLSLLSDAWKGFGREMAKSFQEK